MKAHLKDRTDDTRQAYLDALERLKNGQPTNEQLKNKGYKINAQTIALEANRSRNPLYNTHKDILELIQKEIVKKPKQINSKDELILQLKEKIKVLENENKKLLTVNAMYLQKIL